jgi:hypothetical protein
MAVVDRFVHRDPDDGSLVVNWSVDPQDDSRFSATFSVEDGEWALIIGSDRRHLTVHGTVPGRGPFDLEVGWWGPRPGPLQVHWSLRGPSPGVSLWLLGRRWSIVPAARLEPLCGGPPGSGSR